MAMTAFACGDINERLHQWGLWSRGDGLGASRLRVGGGVIPDITEDEGAIMDRCVLRLKAKGDWQAFEVVCRHYQRGCSLREIAVELGMKPRAVRDHHDRARYILSDAVDWALELAARCPDYFFNKSLDSDVTCC